MSNSARRKNPINFSDAQPVTRYHISARRANRWLQNGNNHFSRPDSLPAPSSAGRREVIRLRKIIKNQEMQINLINELLQHSELTLDDRCQVIDQWSQKGYPIVKLCQAAQVARSSYYAWRERQKDPENHYSTQGRPVPGFSLTESGQRISDEQITRWISEILEDTPSMGYRKLTEIIRQEHHLIINKKKVYRMIKNLL